MDSYVDFTVKTMKLFNEDTVTLSEFRQMLGKWWDQLETTFPRGAYNSPVYELHAKLLDEFETMWSKFSHLSRTL